jgi:glycosyltransferase involved in cell wall biosynthesis
MPYFLAKESMKVAKKLGIKIVCHSHTQPENLFSRLPKFLQMKMFNHIFYKYLVGIYTNSEITICPSNLAVKLLKRYSPSINTTVISNGIDLDYWKKIKYIQFIKKYHLSSSDKRLLFVGRLHPEKDVATLIKTMPKIIAEYPQIHLDIVGIGYLDESLKELSKKLHVENKVTLYGRLSDKDLLMTYSACDIFVLPSLAELEGMVVLEAMTCGKPILIANAPNSASVQFVHKNGFLFKPEDKNDLSKNILKILKDEKLCKKMGEESLKIIKYYDIKNSVTLLEKTYDALMINKV